MGRWPGMEFAGLEVAPGESGGRNGDRVWRPRDISVTLLFSWQTPPSGITTHTSSASHCDALRPATPLGPWEFSRCVTIVWGHHRTCSSSSTKTGLWALDFTVAVLGLLPFHMYFRVNFFFFLVFIFLLLFLKIFIQLQLPAFSPHPSTPPQPTPPPSPTSTP